MEQRSWIERTRDAQDGRAMQIRLTAAGRTVADDLATARQAKLASMVAVIPVEQRASVIQTLGMLVEALREQH
jgi:DNA-binding MarR family transcriptional regulator